MAFYISNYNNNKKNVNKTTSNTNILFTNTNHLALQCLKNIFVKNSFRLLLRTCFHKPDSIDKFFHSPHMPDPKQHCCLHNNVSNIMLKNKTTIQWVLTEKMVC